MLSDLYLKLRYEQEWTFAEKCRLFFQETPYWALNDGLGETTVLEFEHALTSDLSLRWLNSGTLSEEDDGLDWYNSIKLHQSFEDNRQLSGEFLLDGETGAPVAVADYSILMKWRQPVWRESLWRGHGRSLLAPGKAGSRQGKPVGLRVGPANEFLRGSDDKPA